MFPFGYVLPFDPIHIRPIQKIHHMYHSCRHHPTILRPLILCYPHVKFVSGLRHIKELQAHDQEVVKIAVKQAVQETEGLLGEPLKEHQRYPLVKRFVRQFKKAMHRYRFLVLAGPSRVGKTEFARSLCEPGMETLEVKPPSDPEMT